MPQCSTYGLHMYFLKILFKKNHIIILFYYSSYNSIQHVWRMKCFYTGRNLIHTCPTSQTHPCRQTSKLDHSEYIQSKMHLTWYSVWLRFVSDFTGRFCNVDAELKVFAGLLLVHLMQLVVVRHHLKSSQMETGSNQVFFQSHCFMLNCC